MLSFELFLLLISAYKLFFSKKFANTFKDLIYLSIYSLHFLFTLFNITFVSLEGFLRFLPLPPKIDGGG